MYDFYKPIGYTIKPVGDNPTYPKEDKYRIGLYLSLACNAAKFNTYYVLSQKGRVVTRTEVSPFSVERHWDPVVRKLINTFDSKTKRRWKLDNDADVQKAAPTFPEFDTNLVP